MNRRNFLFRGGAGLALLSGSVPLATFSAAGEDAVIERRKRYLEELRKVLPQTRLLGDNERINVFDKSFEQWQKRTGELPPDFDNMPSEAELPDPLVFMENGRMTAVTNIEQWEKKKTWIRSQFEQWIIGKMPPSPENLRPVVTSTQRTREVTVRNVRLEFGPQHGGVLRLELLIPPGKGPFPVFLTDMNRRDPLAVPWINTAIRRGYITCEYFAASSRLGQEDDSDKFLDVYPDYDFSCLARWAWAAMRAVDYLYALPEVDRQKIGLTGLSRYGKQALIAAAFDERISAVIPANGNTGECDPWRFATYPFNVETLDSITGDNPHWFLPRLRFFSGREDKLPVDQNLLMALVAPRSMLVTTSYGEGDANVLGFEQAYRSVRKVYRLFGREQDLGLYFRAGYHLTTADDVEEFMDFFDSVFGRETFPKPETWMLGYTFEGWKDISGEKVDPRTFPSRKLGYFLLQADGRPLRSLADWNPKKATIREEINWALGEQPAGIPYDVRKTLQGTVNPVNGWEGTVLGRPLNIPRVGTTALGFADYLRADLYYPTGDDGQPLPPPPPRRKWPVVIWLHSYSYNAGYSAYAEPVISPLVQQGFAVFAFDQVAFGPRIHEMRNFYQRYPHWSLMGRMVSDARAALDALSAVDSVDSSRIYMLGYALGAKVALFTAALDDRVAGVAAVAGMAPLRLDSPEKGTEGIKHYSHVHGLLPRFGFFVGHNERLPVDYDEILSLIAPRPALIIAPTLDRYNPADDVRRAIEQAREIYRLSGHEDMLALDTPLDLNWFSQPMRDRVCSWLGLQAQPALVGSLGLRRIGKYA
jgi:dienelactone hydrolase